MHRDGASCSLAGTIWRRCPGSLHSGLHLALGQTEYVQK